MRHAERALVAIRSPFEHEARALRAAQTLRGLGFEVTVLASRGARGAAPSEQRDGLRVVRVGTASTLLRRAYSRARSLFATPAEPGTTGDRGRAARGSSLGREAEAGRRLVTRATLGRLVRWATTVDFYLRALAVVRATRPHILHLSDYSTMWLGVVARLRYGSAVVYDSRELWPDRNLRPEARWWLLLWEALFVRAAHRVVMTSPGHAEVLARRHRVPEPVIVRNVPDPGEPRPASGSPRARAAEHPVAIYSGGLLRNRGIEQAIAALGVLDGVRLRLLGPVSPEYRAELEGLADEVGVRERVEFAPPVPPTEVVGELESADAGLVLFQPVCLSHRLVLPNKLFEYVLAGLPVVGSDLPMIAGFIEEHGVGATAPPQDVDAIAAALAHVLAPERNRELRAAAESARGAVDWRREREVLVSVYRDALAGAGQPLPVPG